MRTLHAALLASVSLSLAACDLSYLGPGSADSSVADAGSTECGTFTQPPASSLTDDFSGSTPSPNWVEVGNCVNRATNEVVAAPPASSPGSYCLYNTAINYHLTCDGITVKVPTVTSSQIGVQTVLYINGASQDATSVLLEAGGFSLDVPGKNITGPGYDPTQDLWWALRERDGTVVFETSPDGVAWTTRIQTPATTSYDNVQISIGAGTYASVANPGQATFRCYNKPPPCE